MKKPKSRNPIASLLRNPQFAQKKNKGKPKGEPYGFDALELELFESDEEDVVKTFEKIKDDQL